MVGAFLLSYGVRRVGAVWTSVIGGRQSVLTMIPLSAATLMPIVVTASSAPAMSLATAILSEEPLINAKIKHCHSSWMSPAHGRR